MRSMLIRLAEILAKRRVFSRSDCRVADSAKVSYRGLKRSPPSVLRIGSRSIFEGSIISDRTGSTVSIGSDTFIGGSTLVCAERIEIGNDVLISWGCTIVDHNSHAVDWTGRCNDVRDWYAGKKDWANVKVRPVRICDRAWIGFNTIVLAGVTIGEGAVVGCGSVVTKDVPRNCVVAGNPARVIRTMEHAA